MAFDETIVPKLLWNTNTDKMMQALELSIKLSVKYDMPFNYKNLGIETEYEYDNTFSGWGTS